MSQYPDNDPEFRDPGGSIELVIDPQPRDLGGFEVRRVLPSARRRLVGPFIFFDEIGPAQFAPGHGIDVRPHPHIGLATVTYLFEGEIDHRDSLGYVQTIRPGAVNWMVAGRGIVHSERTGPAARRKGQRLHGIQTWVALPLEQEQAEPGFHHVAKSNLPTLTLDGIEARVIAGNWRGVQSPAPVASPTCYVDLMLEADASLKLEPEHRDLAIYPLDAGLTLNGTPLTARRLYLLADQATPIVSAERSARLLLVGGAPLEGRRHIWWNFVSSSRERMEQAKADWRAMRMGTVPGDPEFIPLPDD